MTIEECYERGLPAKAASRLAGISYDRAMKSYSILRMEEYAPSGTVRKNLREVNKIERDLFMLIDQARGVNDPKILNRIDDQSIMYAQFNALSLTQTI